MAPGRICVRSIMELFIALSVAGALSSARAWEWNTTVQTEYGYVRGGLEGGDVNVFHSVPFASPPTGALRFAVPQPPEPWEGVKDVYGLSAMCPQLKIVNGERRRRLARGAQGSCVAGVLTRVCTRPPPARRRSHCADIYVGNEDCLYLNIYVPRPNATSGALLPVMFWIFGARSQNTARACNAHACTHTSPHTRSSSLLRVLPVYIWYWYYAHTHARTNVRAHCMNFGVCRRRV